MLFENSREFIRFPSNFKEVIGKKIDRWYSFGPGNKNKLESIVNLLLVDFIFNAKKDMEIYGAGEIIERGQLITSVKNISEKHPYLSIQSITRGINFLARNGFITTKTLHRYGTLITIVDYDSFEVSENL